jgi:hypothetical protein|tara:strand:- start:4012 stop:5946 length:1935 start_codon:yes stop_codon:yes gene_type:complete
MYQARNQQTRAVKPDWMTSTGPYIGKIVNHLDVEYMGSIEVEILKNSGIGANEESSGYFIPCTYVSPFMGVTPREGVNVNDGYDNTQKSYGMWAIPPDIGVKVLVLMAENNYSHGYWIGCVQDHFMNFMMPGYAATTYNDTDKSKMIPVAEYNKKIIRSKPAGKGNDPTQFEKSHAKDHLDIITNQGIQDDQMRGTNTSSARREVPSMVFGWSTPGPLDRRDGKPKVKYGEKYAQANIPWSRLGGTSLVMDDGDEKILRKKSASTDPPDYAKVEANDKSGDPTLLHNELVRLKTRTGHQILLHNTEDLIYVINAQGTAWIELTSNGKIDIYAKDSVSVHTENDFNVKAKRDINLEAAGNVNIKANEQMRLESGNRTHWKVGTAEVKKDPSLRPELGIKNEDGTWKWDSFESLPTVDQPGDNLYIDVSRDVYWKVGTHPKLGDFKLEVSQDGHATFDRDFFLLAKRNIHQHSNKKTYHAADTTFDQKSGEEFYQHSGTDMHIKSDKHLRIYADVNATVKAKNNFFTAMNANHVKSANKNFITAGSSNEYNAPLNKMSQIQQFGSGSERGTNGPTALAAANAQDAVLPELTDPAYLPIRIPMHEPYYSHENLKPEMFYRDKTDSTTRTPQVEEKYSETIDTFRKAK